VAAGAERFDRMNRSIRMMVRTIIAS